MSLENGLVSDVEVLRGAPCGATWEAAASVIGLPASQAGIKLGLETQYACSANPAGWDPIYGQSPVHFAAEIHRTAFMRAVGVNEGR